MEEITRKSVLTEVLREKEARLAMCSQNGMSLIPLKGLEDEFNTLQRKCEILRELVHAYDSEPVRRSIANWQKELMDGKPPQQLMADVSQVPDIQVPDIEEGMIFR